MEEHFTLSYIYENIRSTIKKDWTLLMVSILICIAGYGVAELIISIPTNIIVGPQMKAMQETIIANIRSHQGTGMPNFSEVMKEMWPIYLKIYIKFAPLYIATAIAINAVMAYGIGAITNIYLKAIDLKPLQFSDLLISVRKWLRIFIAMELLAIAKVIVTLILLIPGGIIYAHSHVFPLSNIYIAGGICLTLFTYLDIRILFYTCFIVDQNCGMWESIKRSWQITSGHFWKIWGLLIIFIFTYIFSFFICCVGIILGMMIAVTGFLLMYRILSKTEQPKLASETPPVYQS